MTVGPVELRVIVFPGDQFRGNIVPALRDLVDKQIVRVIDIVFVQKKENGEVSVREMDDLDHHDYQAFDPVVDGVGGLLSDVDVDLLSQVLPINTSAAILLFEELWPIRFQQAVEAAHGELALSESISREAVEELLALQDEHR